MNCPSCKVALVAAGYTHTCERCDGAWIADEVLVPLLEQSASALIALPWRANTEDHIRACPVCDKAMKTVAAGTVALDRCEPHGVWFDAKELAALLGQARDFRVDEPHTPHQGLLARFARLFGG
jgi:Zn-finger nucleic acid-binding protein